MVFRYPGDPSKNYIKRIVGVPGDRIEIVRGAVLVNGSRLEEPYVPEQFRDERSMSEVTVPAGELLCAGRPSGTFPATAATLAWWSGMRSSARRCLPTGRRR